MADKRILDVIQTVARKHNTPAPIVENMVRRLRPSIRLLPQQPSPGRGAPGGCRVGGMPDLPAGHSWPRLSTVWGAPEEVYPPDESLQFLMQINLHQVAPFDLEQELPTAGMLYFFFDWDAEYHGEGDTAYVLLVPEAADLRRLEFPPDLPRKQQYQGLDLLPCLEWTIPSMADMGLSGYDAIMTHSDFWEDVFEGVANAQGVQPANEGSAVVHRLLGHPNFIQTPGIADGTRLLLQVDSDPGSRYEGVPRTGMMWGDSGRIYHILSEEKLRSHSFESVEAFVEMC
jgi:uncharacterized protein YwqG